MSNPTSNISSHLVTHSLLGAATGATITKILDFSWPQGAAIGFTLGTVNGLAQKTIAYFANIKESSALRIGVSVAMLAAVLLTANTSLGLSLLGRVGVSLPPYMVGIIGLYTFITECGLALVPQLTEEITEAAPLNEPAPTTPSLKVHNWEDPDLEKVNTILKEYDQEAAIKKLTNIEIRKIFEKFDKVIEFTERDDLKEYCKKWCKPNDLIDLFVNRFSENKLYTPPTTKEEIATAPKHVMRHFFHEYYLPEDQNVKTAYIARLEELHLLASPPTNDADFDIYSIRDKSRKNQGNLSQTIWIGMDQTIYKKFTEHLEERKKRFLSSKIHTYIGINIFNQSQHNLPEYFKDERNRSRLSDTQLRIVAHFYHSLFKDIFDSQTDSALKNMLNQKNIAIRPNAFKTA